MFRLNTSPLHVHPKLTQIRPEQLHQTQETQLPAFLQNRAKFTAATTTNVVQACHMAVLIFWVSLTWRSCWAAPQGLLFWYATLVFSFFSMALLTPMMQGLFTWAAYLIYFDPLASIPGPRH
jgi:hypothetical protein